MRGEGRRAERWRGGELSNMVKGSQGLQRSKKDIGVGLYTQIGFLP